MALYPGFAGLRVLGAAAVVFSHAFLLAQGDEDAEPLTKILGPGNTVGLYAVFAFFIISGFLLSQSLQNRPCAITFAVNRALRIYPGFAVCIFVSALAIGPLATSLGAREYFFSVEVPQFLQSGLLSISDSRLPGVFDYSGNGLQNVVNGSLWSLRYEISSYLFLLLAWMLVRTPGGLAAVMMVSVLMIQIPQVKHMFSSVAYTLPYFSCGVMMHWLSLRHRTNWMGATWAGGLLAISCLFDLQAYAFAPLGAYLIVFIGERHNPISRISDRYGDCSYGVYLYGWPIEQVIKQSTGTSDPLILFALAAPLTAVIAFLSYHLVERPALELRKTGAKIGRGNCRILLEWADGGGGWARAVIWVFSVGAGAALLTVLAWGGVVASMVLCLMAMVLVLALVGVIRRVLKNGRTSEADLSVDIPLAHLSSTPNYISETVLALQRRGGEVNEGLGLDCLQNDPSDGERRQ